MLTVHQSANSVAVVGVACSGATNHVPLSRLTPPLARRLGALIDFDGLLTDHPTGGDGAGNEAVLARARALASALPGRVTEVSYDTCGDGRWLRHVGDVEFLEAWLHHPEFHLIK
ncbi:DUF6368 family protein [Streptomyces sp. NBC_01261]|uniref:DUF6368 family protein n=1 Tax=Streptomyces sp. NBC_01261 TaxID=2903802 RepID=UPI002E37009E|nr:DUF6368 family protein [Streptomyces sp. NBC_01261]